MKFKYTPIANTGYIEEGQPNPIRFCLVEKTEDGFVNIANWMRCKDFLNDFCVAYNEGPRFAIYGFSTKELKIPKKGESVFLAVTSQTDGFQGNLKAFNEWLDKSGLPQITSHICASVTVLEFPTVYFSNTHNTSLATLIIRLMNVHEEFSSFEDAIKFKGFEPKDQYKWDEVVKHGAYFDIPDELSQYVWYVNSTCNDKTIDPMNYSYSSYVHNNGCLSWIRGMQLLEENV